MDPKSEQKNTNLTFHKILVCYLDMLYKDLLDEDRR